MSRVTSCDGHENTVSNGVGGSRVERIRLGAAERQVSNSSFRAAASLGIICHKVDPSDDARSGSLVDVSFERNTNLRNTHRAASVEDLHSE